MLVRWNFIKIKPWECKESTSGTRARKSADLEQKFKPHSGGVAGARLGACRRPPAGRRPRGMLEAATWDASTRNPDPVLILFC